MHFSGAVASLAMILSAVFLTKVSYAQINYPVWPNSKLPRVAKMWIGTEAKCDNDVQAAFNTWNGVGSKMQWAFNKATSITTGHLVVNDGTYTAVDTAPNSWFPDGNPIQTISSRSEFFGIVDSDIYMDETKYWFSAHSYGFFHCSDDDSPFLPDTADYQSAILHEIGHAAGLPHKDNYACAMFPSLANGTQRRNLCAASKQHYILGIQRERTFSGTSNSLMQLRLANV